MLVCLVMCTFDLDRTEADPDLALLGAQPNRSNAADAGAGHTPLEVVPASTCRHLLLESRTE